MRRTAIRPSIACLTALLFYACSSPYHPILDAITSDFKFQYHDCVPLGWVAVPVAGSYYPGYTASVASVAEFLNAVWRGRIAKSDLHQAAARWEYDILNRLVTAGLLSRTDMPRAFPYYFDTSPYKNNRNSLQYLCYSQVVPTQVLPVQPVAAPHTYHARGQWHRVTFAWTASAAAAWARDG